MMADLVDLLNLRPSLHQHGIAATENFEDIFAELYEHHRGDPLIAELEGKIRQYFADLALPPEVTIYDRLILSLQPRDIIATFNWDPLLFLAYARNAPLRRLPQLAALHGSVAVGACVEHRWHGFRWARCGECGKAYQPVHLLYPIRQKNYQSDSFIAGQWETLRSYMKQAYWLTIFGYSAPETDIEALSLLTDMASANTLRDLGNVEIIDIKSHAELHEKWKPFFVRSHYSIISSIDQSILSRHPRRSSEVLWMQSELLEAQQPRPFPNTSDLQELQQSALALMADDIESRDDSAR